MFVYLYVWLICMGLDIFFNYYICMVIDWYYNIYDCFVNINKRVEKKILDWKIKVIVYFVWGCLIIFFD